MERTRLLQEISKLYYCNDMTQSEIANLFGISRPKVSRMLTEAREKGIVKIFVSEVSEDTKFMEELFLSKFKLKGIKIVSVPPSDELLAFDLLTREAANYISTLLKDGDRIGLGWGSTLREISRNLPIISLPNTTIAQLSGNLDSADTFNFANDIINLFARKLGSKMAYTLPCPIIVENSIIVDIMKHDKKLRENLKFASSCNKIITSIGIVDATKNCLFKSGYLQQEDAEHLIALGAVGNLNCRFYNDVGEVCDKDLDDRTMGVSLEDIRKSECVIVCVSGIHKAQAVLGALNAQFIDVLIIDSVIANEIFSLTEPEKSNK